MNWLRDLWQRFFPTPDTGGDAAPFDHVRALAQSLCREEGRDWAAPHTKRTAYIARAVKLVDDMRIRR